MKNKNEKWKPSNWDEVNSGFEKFLQDKPDIRELALKYPPGVYRMKEGSPYAIAIPGTIVLIAAYHPDNKVVIVVAFANKLPEGIEQQKFLLYRRGKSPEEAAEVICADTAMEVDPVWLEPANPDIPNIG